MAEGYAFDQAPKRVLKQNNVRMMFDQIWTGAFWDSDIGGIKSFDLINLISEISHYMAILP